MPRLLAARSVSRLGWTRLLVLSLVCGCGAYNPPIQDDPLFKQAVVAKRVSEVPLPDSGTFAWLDSSRLEPAPGIDVAALDGTVRETLRLRLGAKGYTPAAEAPTAFWVGYVGALRSQMNDATLSTVFGLDTGWHPPPSESTAYEKGTFVVLVVDAKTQRVAFRAAVQANVAAEMSVRERQERVRGVVTLLMSRFVP